MKESAFANKHALQYYHQIKNKITLSLNLKLRLYFATLEHLTQNPPSPQQDKLKIIDPFFVSGFTKLSYQQKTEFLLSLISDLSTQLTQEPKTTPKSNQHIENIQTSCQLQNYSWGLTFWYQAKFKYDIVREVITIANKKRNIVLRLKNYIVRKSRKHKNTLVLEAASCEVSEQNRRICLYFEQFIFSTIYDKLFEAVSQITLTDLTKLINNNNLDNDNPRNEIINTSLIFLSAEQLNLFIQFKTKIGFMVQNTNLSLKNIFHNPQDKISIYQSLKIDKLFKLQFQIQDKNPQSVKHFFIKAYQTRFRYRIAHNVQQQFSKKYKAVYDRYLINNKFYEQISIAEDCSGQQILFTKGVQNIMTGNYLQFILIKSERKGQNTKINVFASLALGQSENLQIVNSLLLQFHEMLTRSQMDQTLIQINNQNDQMFYSIIGTSECPEFVTVQFDAQPEDCILPSQLTQPEKDNPSIIKNFLTHTHQLSPQPLTTDELTDHLLKEHYLLKQWARCKYGGMICIDQVMIRQQNKMMKTVASNIKANFYKIIKTGSLLTLSLPVTIFKKQSHLQTIANDFAYAPLLFDNVGSDPFLRFKRAILLSISVSNLSISSQKPFNPLLGQTLQAWIAGCPIYLEQISHQPPNSAYFFQGRGYKLYGQIESKAGLAGLNTVKCWSERPNYIEFDDGTIIMLLFSRMLVKGVFMGDREFHFQDKVYVYDIRNHYFAQIQFGPRKKGFMSKGDPEDYLYGRILRTTTAFLNKFKQKNVVIFPTNQDIAKQICLIQGIWNQCICFDGKAEFDFSIQLPYQLSLDPYPLPSNSSYRKDLQQCILGNIEIAQEQKEIIEHQQRRDRKLREQHKK